MNQTKLDLRRRIWNDLRGKCFFFVDSLTSEEINVDFATLDFPVLGKINDRESVMVRQLLGGKRIVLGVA